MDIQGLQKMTLLDYPGRVACTVFLGGCDFRCPFCHNFELVTGPMPKVLGEDELFAFLKKRIGLLDGVAITGGEPCLHKDLPDLLLRIREMGFATKLDTNGFHPDLLAEILDRGLADYVAMDIKNSPEKYALTVGLEQVDLRPIQESISLLKKKYVVTGGKDFDYEFRTTVVKEFHEAFDFLAIGQMIEGANRYFLQCFTDRDSVPFAGLHAPEDGQMHAYLEIVKPFVGLAELRGVDS